MQKLKFKRLCQKYKNIEGGCSNIQHGDHDQNTTKNTSDSKFNTSCTKGSENENEEETTTTTTCGS